VSNQREGDVIGDVPEGLLSPKQDGALRAAVTILLDRFFADVGHLKAGGDFADTDMAEYLPPRFAAKYNHVFAKEFLVCLATVATKLIQPGNWPLACVGEELALSAMIQDAETILEERGGEADLGDFRELATKDNDYLMLFDMAWDGIEDADLGRQVRVMNLALNEWFEPFYEGIPVHPYVEPEPPSFS
jgi:hypothetical protein